MDKRLIVLSKLRQWPQEIRSSFWFIPAAIVVCAVLLAVILIAIDTSVNLSFVDDWQLLFGAGDDGARSLLAAVASSMITVTGVVFSITIVALALTSSQYTSRVLRNFMRDRSNQTVLGVFLGIFAYCLVGLRVIRGGDDNSFVPALTVLGGLVLAFVGIAYLIFFIHYISMSIQASSIIASAAGETVAAVDRLFPEALGKDAGDRSSEQLTTPPADLTWHGIPSKRTGYIENIDSEALLVFARENKTVLRMERGIGDFVIEGSPMVSVAKSFDLTDDVKDELIALYGIGRYRTVEQDAEFGIRQIVDIALKALSPGINDTTTAVMCTDYLAAILARLVSRHIPTAHRLDQGELRVIARGPSFEGLLAEAFDQIRQSAECNFAVLIRQLEALESIASHTNNCRRKLVLRQHVKESAELAEEAAASPRDRAELEAVLSRLNEVLAASDEN
jgi:uncharacterized membrane protein